MANYLHYTSGNRLSPKQCLGIEPNMNKRDFWCHEFLKFILLIFSNVCCLQKIKTKMSNMHKDMWSIREMQIYTVLSVGIGRRQEKWSVEMCRQRLLSPCLLVFPVESILAEHHILIVFPKIGIIPTDHACAVHTDCVREEQDKGCSLREGELEAKGCPRTSRTGATPDRAHPLEPTSAKQNISGDDGQVLPRVQIIRQYHEAGWRSSQEVSWQVGVRIRSSDCPVGS